MLKVSAVDNDNAPYILEVPVTLMGAVVANAGPDKVITSNVLQVNMEATTPARGQGTWTIISGFGGLFTDIHDPRTLFTGIACQAYMLRWTVQTTLSSAYDDVLVQFFHTPSKAFAGNDIVYSDGRLTTNLNATPPIVGTGVWTFLAGNNGSLADPSSPTSRFIGEACVTYQLIWTVSTECAVSRDTVQVNFNQQVINANAGPDQVFSDGRFQTTLAAALPAGASGKWSVIGGQGAVFGDNTRANSTFTGNLCSTYILRWTVSTNCGSASDDVTIIFDEQPTDANAGQDVILSSGTKTYILQGNLPGRGESLWKIISGTGGEIDDPEDPRSLFRGQACQTYVLEYAISTNCDQSTDQMTISIADDPTVPYAGQDQHLIDASTETYLQANVATNGTGTWSVVSGGVGTFSDVNNPGALLSGIVCNQYVLRWTIATACRSLSDEVVIIFNDVSYPADAGPDRHFSDGTTSVMLQGNEPKIGSEGKWTIELGSNGIIAELHNPSSMFTGQLGQVYKLKWSIGSACTLNHDLVYLAFLTEGTLVDSRNSKIYGTILIGGQTWMSQNLDFPTLNSWAFEGQATYPTTYGRLYSHSAALMACPAGWRLPSDDDWRILEKTLGMSELTTQTEWYRGQTEGGMLKEAGYVHWQGPNTGANNLVFFSALPGGYRNSSGSFGALGTQAGFWSSTTGEQNRAIYRALLKDKAQIGRDWSDQGFGFSVRCIKE